MTKLQVESFITSIEGAMHQAMGYYVFIPFPIQENINGKMSNSAGYHLSALAIAKKVKNLGYTALVYEGNDQMPGGIMVAQSDDPKMRVFKHKKHNNGFPVDDAFSIQQYASGSAGINMMTSSGHHIALSDLEPGSV